MIEKGTPVLALISNNEEVAAHTRGNVMETVARGASAITIVEEGVAREDDTIVINQVHPYLSAISMVIPTQLIAYYASMQRGLDVDKPRNLAKAVTIEFYYIINMSQSKMENLSLKSTYQTVRP